MLNFKIRCTRRSYFVQNKLETRSKSNPHITLTYIHTYGVGIKKEFEQFPTARNLSLVHTRSSFEIQMIQIRLIYKFLEWGSSSFGTLYHIMEWCNMIDIYSNQYGPHLVAYTLLIVCQKIERIKEERHLLIRIKSVRDPTEMTFILVWSNLAIVAISRRSV